ncbi:MAG: hypothetical protein AAF229_01895 [Pseudomonadota bacterium]
MTATEPALRVFNHKVQRRIVGFVSILLAPTLYLLRGEREILDSISSYYWSDAGPVFIAGLAVVAMFLFAYNGRGGGYDQEFWLAKAGGLFALAIALFPTSGDNGEAPPNWTISATAVFNIEPHHVHIAAAVLLFLVLPKMLWIFSRRAWEKRRPGRGRLYKAFAIAMAVGLVVGAIYMFFKIRGQVLPVFSNSSFVYWLELYMLSLFGTAWLIAGVYTDSDEEPQTTET